MNEKQFGIHINKIQNFMGLDNWVISYQIKPLSCESNKWSVDAVCTSILYDYFSCNIQFSKDMVDNDVDDYIIHVIFHELSHIYTTNAMKIYENNDDVLIDVNGRVIFDQIRRQMIIVNEQQTEFLARTMEKIYLKK